MLSQSSHLICFLIFIIISNDLTNAQNPEPIDKYPNQILLESPDLYYLYWKHDSIDITFEIHYKNTSKWVAFGIQSPTTAEISYSDLIFGWVNDDGTGHFSDRKLVTSSNQLTVDDNQDWLIKDAFNKNNYKILIFTRKIKQFCNANSVDDLDIQTGQNRIVYAMGKQVNNNDGRVLDFSSVKLNPSITLLTGNSFECQTKQVPSTFTSEPTGVYSNNVDLIDNGIYRFYWDFTSTDLTGEIHVKTNGWVAFGLSPNGGMDKSDVIVAWINDNTGAVNFTDRNINKRQVLIDKKQDWKLLSSSQKNGYSIFKFTRPLILCDSEDITIQAGSPFLIFAYGLTDPQLGQDIGYHEARRGSKVVNLISSAVDKNIAIPNVETLEMTIANVIIPKEEDTYYYCTSFKIPDNLLTPKRHILKWELVLPKMNIPNIHHLVIYECFGNYNGTPAVEPGDCNTNVNKQSYCPIITHVWSYGGDPVSIYPKDMGYPIGGDSAYKYVVLEVHYDNPQLNIGYIENLKVRYYMSKNLQPNELATLTVGAFLDAFSITLPPKTESIGINTYCSAACLSKVLDQKNITIISSIPHTHLAGTEIWTKIYRNGQDIGYLFRNRNYDFNYQNNYILNPFVNITKNDELVTYCRYNTANRDKYSRAGHRTRDEMCYQFLTYYPRSAGLKFCWTGISSEQFGNFLLKMKNDGEIKIDNFNVSNYFSVEKAFFEDYMNKNNIYSPSFIKKLTEFYDTTKLGSLCNGEYNPNYVRPKASNVWVDRDQCGKVITDNQQPTQLLNKSNSFNKSSYLYFYVLILGLLFGIFLN